VIEDSRRLRMVWFDKGRQGGRWFRRDIRNAGPRNRVASAASTLVASARTRGREPRRNHRPVAGFSFAPNAEPVGSIALAPAVAVELAIILRAQAELRDQMLSASKVNAPKSEDQDRRRCVIVLKPVSLDNATGRALRYTQ
jgi:hypothetical protein